MVKLEEPVGRNGKSEKMFTAGFKTGKGSLMRVEHMCLLFGVGMEN